VLLDNRLLEFSDDASVGCDSGRLVSIQVIVGVAVGVCGMGVGVLVGCAGIGVGAMIGSETMTT